MYRLLITHGSSRFYAGSRAKAMAETFIKRGERFWIKYASRPVYPGPSHRYVPNRTSLASSRLTTVILLTKMVCTDARVRTPLLLALRDRERFTFQSAVKRTCIDRVDFQRGSLPRREYNPTRITKHAIPNHYLRISPR